MIMFMFMIMVMAMVSDLLSGSLCALCSVGFHEGDEALGSPVGLVFDAGLVTSREDIDGGEALDDHKRVIVGGGIDLRDHHVLDALVVFTNLVVDRDQSLAVACLHNEG